MMLLQIALALLLLVCALKGQGSVSQTNYTVSYASNLINQTLEYINTVNQSGYLVFYPDLSKAYSYINQSQQVYKKSPDSAVAYANQAAVSAKAQYSLINSYKPNAFLVMAFFTIITFILVYMMMKPVRRKARRRARR